MTIRKLPSGKYQVDLNFDRHRKRIRKNFDNLKDAKTFERQTKAEWEEAKITGRGFIDPSCSLTLEDAIHKWHAISGFSLRDKKRYPKLLNLCAQWGNPKIAEINQDAIIYLRDLRLKEVSQNSWNHDHAYLSAVMSEMVRADLLRFNPFSKVRKMRIVERELGYLSLEQVDKLLAVLSAICQDTWNTARLCLSTGARWGEAASARRSQIAGNRITFVETKSGKNRTVPLDPVLATELTQGKNPALFPQASVKKFTRAIRLAEIELQPGQSTHVMRHTFASHFVMAGGDILMLQKILGHAEIKMTLRYAHLSPDHLIQAVEMNPLALLKKE